MAKLGMKERFCRLHKVNIASNFFSLLTSSKQVFKMFICNSARMQTVSCFLYLLMAASMTLCCRLCQTSTRHCFSLSTPLITVSVTFNFLSAYYWCYLQLLLKFVLKVGWNTFSQHSVEQILRLYPAKIAWWTFRQQSITKHQHSKVSRNISIFEI